MNASWYSDFFQGVVVEMWRNAAPLEHTLAEVEFLERQLQLPAGASVLDVPCGFGRHSLELARRGFQMTGADVSQEMLAEAQRVAAAAQLEVQWRHAEMRELGEQEQYDAAFCLGNSFGYLDRTGTAQFLAAVAGALKPGGRFAMDYGLAAECILPRFTPQQWAPIEGLYFLEENIYHVENSCIETNYTFIRDGEVDQRTGLHYVYTIAEVKAMLVAAGLRVEAIFGGVNEAEFELGSPLLLVVAEKTA